MTHTTRTRQHSQILWTYHQAIIHQQTHRNCNASITETAAFSFHQHAKHTTRTHTTLTMTATTPVHVPRSAAVAADPYYSNKSFYMMSPVAVLYSAFAHLVLFLAKPFPFHIPVTNVDDILPQHRFIASKGHANLAIVTGSNTGIGLVRDSIVTCASGIHCHSRL